MSSRTLVLCAVALGTLALFVPSAGAGKERHSTLEPQSDSRLRVTEVEYRLLLSNSVIKAGPVNLAAIDRGMDPHDLRLQASGSRSPISVPELNSGQHWSGVVNLKPGVYRLWCSLPEHALLGMHAVLRVVR